MLELNTKVNTDYIVSFCWQLTLYLFLQISAIFDAHCCHMGTAINYPVLLPDRVKPSFVILISGHSDAQPWTSECPDVKNYKWRLNPIWYRMLYSCTHMATVGVKGSVFWLIETWTQTVTVLYTLCLAPVLGAFPVWWGKEWPLGVPWCCVL